MSRAAPSNGQAALSRVGQGATAVAGEPAPVAGLPADGPLMSRVRAAIRDLQALVRARSADSARIEREHREGLGSAEAAHSTASATAQAEHGAAIARAEEAFGARAGQIGAAFSSGSAEADRALSAALGITEERALNDLQTAKKQFDDRVWMAESLFDNNKDKPRLAFEALKKDLDGRLAQVENMRRQAEWYLRRYRQHALPEKSHDAEKGHGDGSPGREGEEAAAASDASGSAADGHDSAESPAKPGGKALVDQFKSASERVRKDLHTLGRLKLPRLFVTILPGVLALLGGAAVGAVFWWLDNWQWIYPHVWVGLGIGTVVTAAALAGLFVLSRRRSAVVGGALAQAVADARGLHRACLDDAMATRRAQEKAIAHRRERELKQAKQVHGETDAAVRRRAAEEVRKARSRFAEAKSAAARQRDADTADLDRGDREARERAEELRRRACDTAGALRATDVAGIESRYSEQWGAMEEAWKSGLSRVQHEMAALAGTVGDLNPPWSGDAWENRPRLTDGPGPVRIASLRVDLAAIPDGLPTDPRLAAAGPTAFDLPVPLEAPQRFSLLVQSAPEQRLAAISLLQAAMLRLLTVFPPGKVRFTLVDPVGLGQSFAGFMHLADYEPLLVSDRIWTETRHIEQRLADLTEHMENVIQKYLRNEFATIEDYNLHAGEVAEPYRFLVIADFPAAFSDQAAQRLQSIIQSGPRCGVYTLIGADVRQKMPGAGSGSLRMADIERQSLTLAWRGERFVLLDPELADLPLTPEQPPLEDRARELVHELGRTAKDSGKVRVPFEMITPRGEQAWSGDTTSDLRVPLGRLGATKLQHLVLGRGTAQHALIAGRTGSGKSTLMNVIITNVALWYSPAQVELYLIDFKKGVEFKAYAASRMPHARVIAIESEREFGLSALRRLDEELKRRGQMFRDVGAQDVAAFRRAKPGVVLPRVLLIVDEFQEMFSEDDKLAQEASLLLDRLVRQGRAFGMHVILGSQTLAGAYSLARSTIGQMAVRIALQCSEADSYLILSDDNGAARLLSRPGEAIYNDASGMLEGNSPFQIAWLADEQRERQLERVHEVADQKIPPAERPDPPIVFEGNQPADVAVNHVLARAIAQPARTGPITPRAWLGEPVSIKDPTAASFTRQSSSNLLIVGQREEAAAAMLAASIVGLWAQQGPIPGDAGVTAGVRRFTILDGTPADSPLASVLPAARAVLPSPDAEAALVPYREVGPAIAALSTELERRQQGDLTDAPGLFLVINGLQRFRVLRKQDDDFGVSFGEEKAATPDQQLVKLLREGPGLGIFTLVWCDTVANLERTLPRAALKEFDMRVVFQMSQADSSALIDAPSAGALGQHRALFYSESQGVIEKFRPYRVPDEQWLAEAGAKLRSRRGG